MTTLADTANLFTGFAFKASDDFFGGFIPRKNPDLKGPGSGSGGDSGDDGGGGGHFIPGDEDWGALVTLVAGFIIWILMFLLVEFSCVMWRNPFPFGVGS